MKSLQQPCNAVLYFDLFCNRSLVTFTDTKEEPQLWDRAIPEIPAQKKALHIRAYAVSLAKTEYGTKDLCIALKSWFV